MKSENRISEKLPYLLIVISSIILCLHAIGVYIQFLVIDGYKTIPSDGVLFLYDESDGVQNFCLNLLLLSIVFMNLVYRKEHDGVRKLLSSIFSVLLPLSLILPHIIRSIVFLIGDSEWLIKKFPVGVEMAESLEELAFLFCGMLLTISVIIPFFMFIKNDKYRRFLKCWGVAFLINIGGIRLVLSILSHKILVILCVIASSVILVIILYQAVKQRCPKCKRFFGMKYIRIELIQEEEISIKVKNEIKNSMGHVTGTSEQYIPGKRKVYEETYQCKHCGYIQKKSVKKDITAL